MPPKDRIKYVSKMNTQELKKVAKNTGINIDGADTVPKMRKVIIAASGGYSRKYDFVSNTWTTGTEDAQMASTQAITATEDYPGQEDQEDPRTDDAKKIQQVVRARQEKKMSAINIIQKVVKGREGRSEVAKLKKEQAINIIQKIVKGREGRSEVAKLKLTKKQLLDKIARLEGQMKDETPARAEITREEKVTNEAMREYMKTLVDKTTENEEASKATPKPIPKATPKPWGRGALPPVPPPGIFPIQPKELEEDHKEENQLKKITRHNVEKIDDSVKVKPSSTVKPTIDASDIRQALAKSNNRRFKIGTNVITYHRLNGIGKTATQFL